jgi:regulator of sigma E protease
VSYLLAFLGFAALIILHEGGHFLAAKAVGMRVEKFSLFFGPMIVKRQIGETLYGIGVIPLGGFVKISGMTPQEEFEDSDAAADRPRVVAGGPMPRPAVAPAVHDPRGYSSMPVWKRVVVIAAGPSVNLLVAFVIFSALFLHYGAVVTGPREIQSVVSQSAAAGALKPGDHLISLDGVSSSQGFKRVTDASHCAGTPVNGCVASPAVAVVVRRDGHLLRFSLHPHYNAKAKRPLIGFSYGNQDIDPVGLLSSAGWSVKSMWQEASRTLSAFAHIFQAKERRQLHSVVGAYKITQEAVSDGPEEALEVLAAISLALAVINLFPFLPLDGGHIFWAVAERVRGRRISLATIERASIVGLVLVLMLFAIGLSNDIPSLIHGQLGLH